MLPFDLPPWLLQFLGDYRYAILFFAGMFEGPVATLTGGFLIRTGQLDFLPAYLALLIGDAIEDLGWNFVGYHGFARIIEKHGHRFGITQEAEKKVRHLFHRYHERILLVSKLTMGFGFAIVTLVTAGTLRVPLRTYVLLNLAGGVVWTGMLIGVGYLFGNVYDTVPSTYKLAFVTFGASLLLTLLFLAQWKVKRMASENL